MTDMSSRTHLACTMCWNHRQCNPNKRICPAVPEDFDDDAEPCCFCGTMTSSGIYLRAEPNAGVCGGFGGVHAVSD